MTAPDRARLLVADLERIPAILRRQAAAGSSPARAALTAASGGESGDAGAARGQIVLVGLGSSRFAALAVAPALREAGLDVVVEHASTLRPAPVGPGAIVVGISASGRTPETTAAVLRAAAAGAAVLALTIDPASPLGHAAPAVVTVEAGPDGSGVASASYVATVAALVGLGAALGLPLDPAAVLADAADAAEEVLAGRPRWLPMIADALAGGALVHVLADASALGTAEQAALLLRECPRLDAFATDAGDWLHVGIYTALPGARAILLAGTPYDAELARTIHGRGGTLVAIGPGREAPDGAGLADADADADAEVRLPAAAGDPLVRALVEPVAAMSIAAELWSRARASHA